MSWLVVWSLALIASLVGVIVSAHSLSFQQGAAREARLLSQLPRSREPCAPADLQRLPAPVARYLEIALGGQRTPIRQVRLEHGGAMRTGPEASWAKVHGKQFLVADPPGFVWTGRLHLAPGVWVDARDTLLAGQARMRVLAESTITLADSTGPELDEGAAMRMLGEMLWLPTSYLDTRYVAWSPIDDTRARARLRLGELEVSAVFHFGPDGLPTRIGAERWREVDGRQVLTPWYGEAREYRRVSGVLVPFVMDATWDLETGPFHAIHFEVERIEVDPPLPLAMDASASDRRSS